jgi:hypothetical protein
MRPCDPFRTGYNDSKEYRKKWRRNPTFVFPQGMVAGWLDSRAFQWPQGRYLDDLGGGALTISRHLGGRLVGECQRRIGGAFLLQSYRVEWRA